MSERAGAVVERWVELGASGEFARGEMRAVSSGGHKLVVGRTDDGEPFALDNRCPHEGYPLATGTLKGTALTCCWHNWKFDVSSGACTLGGEGVRWFPTRERDGRLEVDLADPDPAVRIPEYLASLREAILDGDLGRGLRDGVRALHAGLEPAELFAEVASIDAEHAEYGCSHVLPVAADSLRSLGVFEGVRAAIPLGTVVDLCVDANQRLPRRPQPAPLPAPPEGFTAAVEEAVEVEDVERAEALLLGAIEAGAPREELDRILLAVISRHFLSFGHPLIYFLKLRELSRWCGPEHVARILPALLVRAAYSTREDTLPYMRALGDRLATLRPRVEELHARAAGAALDFVAVRDRVLGSSPVDALDAVQENLEGGVDPRDIARALVGAAAHRLWRFDLAVEHDPTVIESWLFATHRFTFASAVRAVLDEGVEPSALALLFQAAAFVQTGHRLDRAEGHDLPEAIELGPDGIALALATRDGARAVAGGLGLLRAGSGLPSLQARLRELVHSDPLVRPIVVAHAVKTLEAAFDETEALRDTPDAGMPLAATLRFLASPVVERRVREVAERSIRWVVEGEMPRKLTQ